MCRRNHSYVFIMNISVIYIIIRPYFGCFTGCFLNLTNCKCSWRRDLLNKAAIFQNDVKTSCHAAYIVWNMFIYIYWIFWHCSEFQLVRQCLVVHSVVGAWVPVDSAHFLILLGPFFYNAVPEIRLAGSVSVEWFLAINFQFTVHTRSNGCHPMIAYITNYIS